MCVTFKRFEDFRIAAPGSERAEADRCADQGAGLVHMHAFEFIQTQMLADCRQIECLTTGHALRSTGMCKHAQHFQTRAWLDAEDHVMGEHLESERLQRIASQDGHGLAKFDVASRPSPAQRIIIHGR